MSTSWTGASALGGLLRHAQEQQQRLAEFQRQRAELRVTGESPDGLIRAEIDGDMKVAKIDIDPRAMRLDSFSLAESLRAAIDAGYAAFTERSQELLSEMTGNDDLARRAQDGSLTPEDWFQQFGVDLDAIKRRAG